MIDSHDLRMNLGYLRQVYLEGDRARAKPADEMLRQARQPGAAAGLDRLLRHHADEPVLGEDNEKRDALDFLLAFYGILEIACQIRYVPEPLPKEFAEAALWNLSEPAMVRYYEKYYPVLLPELFRMRLRGELSLYEVLPADPTPVHRPFTEFLSLVNRQQNDQAVDIFLWFLDDGWKEGYNITDTLAVLRKPDKLIRKIVKPPEKLNPLDLSVLGLQRFVALCVELDDLLQRCASYPLLQSALWHYYSYWFECIRGKVGRRVREALQRIRQWKPELDGKAKPEEAAKAIHENVGKVEEVLKRLLSRRYGEELRARMNTRGRPLTEAVGKAIDHLLVLARRGGRPLTGEKLVTLVLNRIRHHGYGVRRSRVRDLVFDELNSRGDAAPFADWINKVREEKGLPG